MGTLLHTTKTHTNMKFSPVLFALAGAKSTDKQFLKRLVASSLAVTEITQKVVNDIFESGSLKVETKKGLKNYVTDADKKIERILAGNLRREFSEIVIYGEENEALQALTAGQFADFETAYQSLPKVNFPGILKPEDITVWLDPLDGTAELVEASVTGNHELTHHVTTLIGIAYQGRPIAGVINQPFHKNTDGSFGYTTWGVVGVGAFERQNSQFGDKSYTIGPIAEGNIITTSRSHADELVMKAIDAFDTTSVLKVGGSGNKVLKLLQGEAHAYMFASPWTKKWDTCAPEAVLEAVGGRLTDIHGNLYNYSKGPNKYNKGGVMATLDSNKLDEYISKIPEKLK